MADAGPSGGGVASSAGAVAPGDLSPAAAHNAPFAHRLRVRYGECDAQGIVFNANYLVYLDHGLTELWRALFGGYAAMTDSGVDVVLAESHLRFRASGHFDEEIDVELAVAALGTTSMSLRARITRADDAALLVEADMRYVWIEVPAHVKTAIPDWARARLEPLTLAASPAAG